MIQLLIRDCGDEDPALVVMAFHSVADAHAWLAREIGARRLEPSWREYATFEDRQAGKQTLYWQPLKQLCPHSSTRRIAQLSQDAWRVNTPGGDYIASGMWAPVEPGLYCSICGKRLGD